MRHIRGKFIGSVLCCLMLTACQAQSTSTLPTSSSFAAEDIITIQPKVTVAPSSKPSAKPVTRPFGSSDLILSTLKLRVTTPTEALIRFGKPTIHFVDPKGKVEKCFYAMPNIELEFRLDEALGALTLMRVTCTAAPSALDGPRGLKIEGDALEYLLQFPFPESDTITDITQIANGSLLDAGIIKQDKTVLYLPPSIVCVRDRRDSGAGSLIFTTKSEDPAPSIALDSTQSEELQTSQPPSDQTVDEQVMMRMLVAFDGEGKVLSWSVVYGTMEDLIGIEKK